LTENQILNLNLTRRFPGFQLLRTMDDKITGMQQMANVTRRYHYHALRFCN